MYKRILLLLVFLILIFNLTQAQSVWKQCFGFDEEVVTYPVGFIFTKDMDLLVVSGCDAFYSIPKKIDYKFSKDSIYLKDPYNLGFNEVSIFNSDTLYFKYSKFYKINRHELLNDSIVIKVVDSHNFTPRFSFFSLNYKKEFYVKGEYNFIGPVEGVIDEYLFFAIIESVEKLREDNEPVNKATSYVEILKFNQNKIVKSQMIKGGMEVNWLLSLISFITL